MNDQLTQARASAFEVLPLRALCLGVDEEATLGIHPPAREFSEPRLLCGRQGRGPAKVEPKRHFGGDLVDVLTPWARRPAGGPGKISSRDRQSRADHQVFARRGCFGGHRAVGLPETWATARPWLAHLEPGPPTESAARRYPRWPKYPKRYSQDEVRVEETPRLHRAPRGNPG